ncbi:hypothetical protein GWC95_01930 [Sediminibacterium roseum]|uniref:Uncharacterized protein n=1 Tax=Sediminibacterium roseum TaxID=1978412 RepID=A0ABW9ZUB4_9BACT|nr:hypothetical protein [Sediminibacterium roseum]NCI48665.1 hypothetical protein [Sediminibacterium roseum]
MKTFKEEDLILYLYKDASPQLTTAIEKALADDDLALKDRLKVLQRTIKQLDKLKLQSPSKKSLREIMKHVGK